MKTGRRKIATVALLALSLANGIAAYGDGRDPAGGGSGDKGGPKKVRDEMLDVIRELLAGRDPAGDGSGDKGKPKQMEDDADMVRELLGRGGGSGGDGGKFAAPAVEDLLLANATIHKCRVAPDVELRRTGTVVCRPPSDDITR
jgi:hypothetical protein